MADHPIIDSHIHLWSRPDFDTLRWATPDNPLAKQLSVDEFRATTSASPSQPRGFIAIEADRDTPFPASADPSTWKGPLDEVAFLRRIATAQPKADDGSSSPADDAALCLAIVPWAPVPAGPEALEQYLAAAEEAAGPEAWKKVKGFRYLVQDKPHGTMLTEEFIQSLRLLGRRGFAFDLGIDQHRRGRTQLEEAVEMVDRAHEGLEENEKVTIVINHMAKPNLEAINPADPSFIAWRVAMYTLSKCSRVYVKLSGGFAELPATIRGKEAEDIFMDIHSWLLVLLAAFGPRRMMFGSDWPVCTVGVETENTKSTSPAAGEKQEEKDEGEGQDAAAEEKKSDPTMAPTAWEKWRRLAARMAWMATMSDEDQASLFGGTAKEAYGIE